MNIRTMQHKDLPQVIDLWNQSVQSGEVAYFEMSEDYFHTKFENDPNYDSRLLLVAEKDETIIGAIGGLAKKIFLDHENNENTPGFITFIYVKKSERRQGVGTALVNALSNLFREMGKSTVAVSNDNTINLDWHIPGTPGHDHNNLPGVDTDCPGYPFLLALGFAEQAREIAMYLNLKNYIPWADMAQKQQQLLNEGVYTGRYDAKLGYDFNRLCDRVGSDYWREVIRSEVACHMEGRPNNDPRFMPNGTKLPAGPRPMLAATCDNHIVAFTGPVDMQLSGRGWFCGIFTDPEFERRGIASILFHLLMQEFIAEGASFSTLFTGETNHAQRIYMRAGFQIVKHCAIMSKAL